MTEETYIGYKLRFSLISHSLFNFCARFVFLFVLLCQILHATDLCDLCSTKGGKGTETKEVRKELYVSHSTQLL